MIHNGTHLQGVHYYKRTNSYRAQISINGKKISLGYYPTPLKAHDAILSFLNIDNSNTCTNPTT
jgi:hypothetical protein